MIVKYTPVILDPNTAHRKLLMSEDLTSVRKGENQPLPVNPERFDDWPSVRCTEGFTSGTHSWEVEVGDNAGWVLGVVADSTQRKDRPLGKHWILFIHRGQYKVHYPPGRVAAVITERQKAKRIRMQLDWDRGRLSFFDGATNTHLHTITATFTEKLYPYILNGSNLHPLNILPLKVCVKIE